MKKRIYIIGKVTGLEHQAVISKFEKIEKKLYQLGYIPINPINVVNDMNADWKAAMRLCIAELMKADAVFVQNDVDDSVGARTELRLCLSLEIPIYNDINILKLNIPTR